VPALTFAFSMDRKERIGKYVVADCIAERLAVIAGGSKMNTAEDTGVLDFVDRSEKIGKIADYAGQPVRRHAESSTLTEVVGEYLGCGTA